MLDKILFVHCAKLLVEAAGKLVFVGGRLGIVVDFGFEVMSE